ncbi:hypothetical protein PFICI_03053 [Pestalotiopsis fici W106-1]|uniref:E3 ubiquitin-protein ligase n=1 Tax=Pestalotiopsis fici (strain W106-1 / CGMCC3.15140) TaxID=1229662 RepID=W3XG03_PESFW|nr:uncharacterized protein PFICI_03053 [Pestalotiopsis fici W106-1]ETS85028.1 hypothetical protein PFICI_03053 [Pestalotiopsis fici W106-1]
MTDILGAISASLDLAIFITKQVGKYKDAPETVRLISDDVLRLSRILEHLRDNLQPHPVSAVRLAPAGLEHGMESVKRCERVLGKIKATLKSIFRTGDWNLPRDEVKQIHLNTLTRISFVVRDSDINKLRAELKECKWDIMLSNSVNQLYLAQQYPELYARDSEKLDYLQELCEYIVTQKLVNQSSNKVPVTPPSMPPGGMDDIFTPNAVHVPGGDKGFGSNLPPRPPSSRPLQTLEIRKVHKSQIAEAVLISERIRWLHDPFDEGFINIHEPLGEERMRHLIRLSRDLLTPTSSSVRYEVITERRDSQRRKEEYERKEDEYMLKEEKLRIEEELRRSDRMPYAESASRGGSSEAHAIPSNNLVADLISQWIIPADPDDRQASKCDRYFEKGERMFYCPVCAYDEDTVFCSDCFIAADHERHGVEARRSNGRGYCDCGHANSVKRRMVCTIHGVNEPKNETQYR